MNTSIPFSNPDAVAFDLDGTLIDTEPLHARAQRKTLEAFGIRTLPPDHPRTFGMGLEPGLAKLCEFYGLEYQDAMSVYLPAWEGLADEALTPMPGARSLLTRLMNRGVPMALVTSADPVHVGNAMSAIDVPNAFQCIVDANMVSRLKPSPEPYVKAADRLGVRPSGVVAFEDSGPGVASVLAANMRCVAVHRDVHSRPELAAAHIRIQSLDECRLFD